MPKPPAWKDEAALVDYVNQAITDLIDNPGSEAYGVSALPRSVAADFLAKAIEDNLVKFDLGLHRFIENEAVDAAVKDGNYMPLARLLDPRHPLNDQRMKPAIHTVLAPTTYALIADILSGRRKRRNHRPRLTAHERRMINRIHDAADEVPGVERMLRAWYPSRRRNQIYDRTLYVVASRHQVKSETLDGYLKRSKGDHRRPIHHPRRKDPGVERLSSAERGPPWLSPRGAERWVRQIEERALYLIASKSKTLDA